VDKGAADVIICSRFEGGSRSTPDGRRFRFLEMPCSEVGETNEVDSSGETSDSEGAGDKSWVLLESEEKGSLWIS